MGRVIAKVISVDKVIKEDVIFNREEISKYTVDKKNKSIIIDVVLTGDDTSLMNTETHRFFSNDFIEEPTEGELWTLIDKKRGDV